MWKIVTEATGGYGILVSAWTAGTLKGKLVYHTADGDIEITDGEAYYVGPGHTPEIYPGTEIVEFSPTADFQTTMDVVGKNMEAMGS
jgi:hypothetical protein